VVLRNYFLSSKPFVCNGDLNFANKSTLRKFGFDQFTALREVFDWELYRSTSRRATTTTLLENDDGQTPREATPLHGHHLSFE
jgi:hypothetical protein